MKKLYILVSLVLIGSIYNSTQAMHLVRQEEKNALITQNNSITKRDIRDLKLFTEKLFYNDKTPVTFSSGILATNEYTFEEKLSLTHQLLCYWVDETQDTEATIKLFKAQETQYESLRFYNNSNSQKKAAALKNLIQEIQQINNNSENKHKVIQLLTGIKNAYAETINREAQETNRSLALTNKRQKNQNHNRNNDENFWGDFWNSLSGIIFEGKIAGMSFSFGITNTNPTNTIEPNNQPLLLTQPPLTAYVEEVSPEDDDTISENAINTNTPTVTDIPDNNGDDESSSNIETKKSKWFQNKKLWFGGISIAAIIGGYFLYTKYWKTN